MTSPGTIGSNETTLRVKAKERELFLRAATSLEKTWTDFVLDAAKSAAEEALLDNRLFKLDKKDFTKFLDALESPPPTNSQLKALLNRRPLWEE